MEALLSQDTFSVHALTVLFLLTPVAITVATIASWRNAVPGAAMIAASGIAYCLWLLAPFDFALPETRLLSQYASVLGWLWLVAAWGRHVLTEWPVPMWGHWIAGTVLLALPFVALVAGLTL